ncbi:MAG: hypothetical protein ACRDPF_28000 [Streptosporangiaceae bacterium]
MGFDLVIRGATVVTPGHREAADIGIADGRIAQLGGTMAGTQELDAGGLLAIPGGVDAHTHLVHQGLGGRLGFPTRVDDFWSGSRGRGHRRHHDDRQHDQPGAGRRWHRGDAGRRYRPGDGRRRS